MGSQQAVSQQPTVLSARAVLFDMDGTLVDSTGAVERVWTAFAHDESLDAAELLANLHGVRAEDTLRRYTPNGYDVADAANRLFELELAETDGIVPISGAGAFLASLPQASIALVTSARRQLALTRLEAAGVPTPAVVVTADDVEHGKPAPDCYLLAATLLGSAPADTIVFEDAEAGIAAGLAAGMRTVVVGGHVSETTRGLPRIPNYDSVRAVLREPAPGDPDRRPVIDISLPAARSDRPAAPHRMDTP